MTATAVRASCQDDPYLLEVEDGERNLMQGKLDRARAAFDEILLAYEEEDPEYAPAPTLVARARLGLWELAFRRGDYEAVLAGLEGAGEGIRGQRGAALLRARCLARLGRYGDARKVLTARLAADPSDAEAGWRLGEILRGMGDESAALAQWNQTIDAVTASDPVDPVALGYAGRCRMGIGGRSSLMAASKDLVASIKEAPDHPAARTALGLLYFRVYGEAAGYPSGEKQLNEVLERNGEVEEALLTLYELRSSNQNLDYRKTLSYLQRVLALNPRCVSAIVQQGASRLHDRRFAAAKEKFREALTINPKDTEAMAHLAAVHYVLGDRDEWRATRDAVLAINNRYAEVDRILGDHLAWLYRFADAVPFYRRALALDAELVPALHGIAKCLVYTGEGPEAAMMLRTAQALEPGQVHPWRNNVLAAQEMIQEEYGVVRSKGLAISLHERDIGVLSQYMLPEHEEARAELGRKYGLLPDEEVAIEVLHTWDDFSVRTTGFRGFTALGACFGNFVTLVSPGDGDVRSQDFMWAATVWHEYAHVLTLSLSEQRIPRWFTEGLSVREERQRNPAWERGMDRDLFQAMHNDRLPEVVGFDRLFRSSQVLFGYFLSGVAVDWLAREHGFEQLVAMCKAFADDRTTAQVLEDVLGVSAREFDQQFGRYVAEEYLDGIQLTPIPDPGRMQRLFALVARNPNDLSARVELGWGHLSQGVTVDAAREVMEIFRRDPDHGPGNLLHAELLRQRGALTEAEAAYQKGFAAGADDFDSRVKYARMLLAAKRVDDAIAQLALAKACWPRCTESQNAPELILAGIHRDAGRRDLELQELKAFCQRTGRAFAPRMRLAGYAKEQGDRTEEIFWLEEALVIDPFSVALHEQLGEAYLALDRALQAGLEFRVAAAIPPSMDREYAMGGGRPPEDQDPAVLEARGERMLRSARAYWQGGAKDVAREVLRECLELSKGDGPGKEAQRLLEEWR